MWAIIGGSGFESFADFKIIEKLDEHTPFGNTSSGFAKASLNGLEILFLPRHGKKHERLPAEVNYRANIYALKKHGASKIVAISSVGSLQEHLQPGDMVVPTQFINRTYGRAHTFCGNGMVGHVSLAHPVTKELVEEIKKISHEFDFKIHFDCTAICIEGPYFSTKAESISYRSADADIIGMTAFPEYALAREAGICYLPCSFVTDLDCWDDSIPHVTLEEMLNALVKNNQKAYALLQRLLPLTANKLTHGCAELGLKTSLITQYENIPSAQQALLEVIAA